MSPEILSLSASALLAALALALLALAVSRLGKAAGLLSALQVMGLIVLKFAVLALGLRWMSEQPWFRPLYAATGVLVSLIVFAFWKGRGPGGKRQNG